MRRLWRRMADVYGQRWASGYGDVTGPAFETWGRALADVAPEQVGRGIAACLDRPDPWPPSLPEFRALCRPRAEVPAPCHRLRPKALPEPAEAKARRTAAGLAAVRSIRAQLAGVEAPVLNGAEA